jgi:putative restriction endonuclease
VAPDRDDDLRMSCFLSLDVLRAQYGDDLPLRGALDQGFPFRGSRVPFFSHMKGIFRAAAQRGPAALAVQTSWQTPYADAPTEGGFSYAYRAGVVDQADNRALRQAYALQVPIVYFVGVRAGIYRPLYPCFVSADDPASGTVVLTPGAMVGPMDEPEALPIVDEVARTYATREVKARLHQARFRGLVLPAYRDRCAICRLKEPRLLDAAHIVADSAAEGSASIRNGLSLCTIHHRAFDQNLVGVSPDYIVRVSPRLLDEEDGPMLDLLKQFHETGLTLPARPQHHPDRERLARRFDAFSAA